MSVLSVLGFMKEKGDFMHVISFLKKKKNGQKRISKNNRKEDEYLSLIFNSTFGGIPMGLTAVFMMFSKNLEEFFLRKFFQFFLR